MAQKGREVLRKVNDEVYERGRSQAVPGDSRIQMFPLKGAEVNLCVKNRDSKAVELNLST